MGMKENLEKLAATMKRWQKLENAAIAQTARIMEQTEHPLIRQVMEIIREKEKDQKGRQNGID